MPPVSVTAASVGIDAEKVLRAGGAGTVIAAFRRSMYLRLPAGIVCLGDDTIGDGPLNLACHGAGRGWLGRVPVGAPACASGGAIHLPDARIDWADAVPWSPPRIACSNRATLAAGLELLEAELPRRLPEGGLAGLARDDRRPRTRVERIAAAAGGRLAAWAVGSGNPPEPVPVEAVEALLGLGPGLTPSGDDYLAGLAFALQALGMHVNRNALARTVSVRAVALTNEISAAHLAAALRGGLRAGLHGVFSSVLTADRAALRIHLAELAAEAHCSPWDAVAGFVAAARSTCASGARPGKPPDRSREFVGADRPALHAKEIDIGCDQCAA